MALDVKQAQEVQQVILPESLTFSYYNLSGTMVMSRT
jgi:hypothetical protein